jgi:DNA-binding beta-propeller fold protein YncE
MQSLQGHVAPHYRGWDLDYSDVSRISAWMKEFDAYERDGGLPALQIVKLPNDHTAGTRHGSLTPRALVAQNDLAVGLLVERISQSRYWKESAIFVIEDDAQNGPDHVDAHRTEALVISPYTKRHFVDHQMYSTCSMVRTMELILGLPPLSQFDAAARPMFDSFSPTPDVTPYSHIEPSVNIEERNPRGAVGQRESGRMDFSGEDRTSMTALNEVIWKSVRGERSEMPPPVRSALVFPLSSDR